MARPSGFFNSTASLKPAFRLFPRPRERRQIISHISRARLTTIFFRPLFPFLSLQPNDPSRWIIILALLDRIFGADDPMSRTRRTRSCSTFSQFTDGVSDGTPEENPRSRMRRHDCPILSPGMTIHIHATIISFLPFDKGWRSGAS